jgi:hypothetical protein
VSTLFRRGQGGEIKRIYPTNDVVYFRLKNDTCISGTQYYYFRMNEADLKGQYAAKNWFSMLLASALESKPISVKVNNCPADGNVEVQYIYQDY